MAITFPFWLRLSNQRMTAMSQEDCLSKEQAQELAIAALSSKNNRLYDIAEIIDPTTKTVIKKYRLDYAGSVHPVEINPSQLR